VLTRRIAAIETLGAATVLCTDKTGTLTQNRMTIAALWEAGETWRPGDPGALPERFRTALEYGILASAPTPFDPMEKAFHALGAERLAPGPGPLAGRILKWEYRLRPDFLAMTQIWEGAGSQPLIAAAKGAPETIAELCRLGKKERTAVDAALQAMSGQGMRVLGVAHAALAHGTDRPGSPRDIAFEFVGLVGLADPLRPTVPAAVRECRGAGIRVVMITGDYPETARVIAAEAGITADAVITGADLDRLSDAELRQRIGDTAIFARIMPEQKLRIVEALKANGEIVAMTGDGVNDAPSLKAAHIGIAMGGRGTDVAREAAALVLLTTGFVIWSLMQGVLVLALVAGLFVGALYRGLPEADARALAFAALVATNVGLVLVDRAGSASLFGAFRQPNPALWWVLGITSAILALIFSIAPARDLFGFGPLHADDLAVALLAGLAALFLLDWMKRAIGPGPRALPA
jgi:Ca2+-transporting ATPase